MIFGQDYDYELYINFLPNFQYHTPNKVINKVMKPRVIKTNIVNVSNSISTPPLNIFKFCYFYTYSST